MERTKIQIGHLTNTVLFSALPEILLHKLLQNNSIIGVSYDSGELVHLEEEPCSTIEIVLKGNLSIEQVGEDGDIFTIATFGPESLIGGNLVFSSLPRYAHTILTIERCLLIRIRADILFCLLTGYSEFLKNFLTLISDNTVMVNDRLSHMMQYSLRQRLLLYIRAEMIRQKSQNVVLSITKTRLAQILGVSRTSVSRELAKMRDEELLILDKRNITLLNK